VPVAGKEQFPAFITIEPFQLLLEHAYSVLLEEQKPRVQLHEAPADVEGRMGSDERCESWVAGWQVFDCCGGLEMTKVTKCA
jgi:hypothetical protein